MKCRPNKLLIISTLIFNLSMIPLIGNAALKTTITKVVDRNGNLNGVVVKTPQVVFYVTVYGRLANITPNNPTLIRAQRIAQALGTKVPQGKPLKIKYYPKSQLDGNGGKVVEVNGIRINYYTCMANSRILIGTRNNANNPMPSPRGNSPIIYNKDFQFACRSLDGNGGKVRSISTINFTYYPNSRVNYNRGKLARVGDYTITYQSPNSFTGKAGQLKSFGN